MVTHSSRKDHECKLCGASFRTKGSLIRHHRRHTDTSSVAGEPMETSPVIHLVTDAKGTVIHEVHVQMQELPLGMKALAPESPDPEELPCSSENNRENLLHQAMQNSGIVLERVAGEESTLEPSPPSVSSHQSLGEGPPELPCWRWNR
ncbi:Transcription factor E4F1 [Cricetulus griseus]|uniref:Transcription factor E4F1 n=1 Tax=Cricetulus griseus TaxID=10029 RepID=G3I2S1_CRIGR|nr:Transcription factor E4F1 [Cricetulus griseus]